jgi:hypothetical protein
MGNVTAVVQPTQAIKPIEIFLRYCGGEKDFWKTWIAFMTPKIVHYFWLILDILGDVLKNKRDVSRAPQSLVEDSFTVTESVVCNT